MKHLNEFLNEGKYQKVWQTQKYVKAGDIELVGDKHSSTTGQSYKIIKNKKEVGSFNFDRNAGSYWLSAPSLEGQTNIQNYFETIDDIIEFVKKNL